jgi:hypothetical protein
MQRLEERMHGILGRALVVAGLTWFLVGGTAPGVDVYDGVRAPRGLYFLSYSTYYFADVLTGPSGGSSLDNFGYQSVKQILRLSWYSPDYVITALAPFGYVRSDYLADSDTGIGDILVAAGGFLPVDSVDLLAFLAAKIPTGEFHVSDAVNVGSGQWDFRPSLFIHKATAPYTFDGVLKYTFRQENPDSDLKPGDEFRVEAMVTRQWGSMKIGPSASWLIGEDEEEDGVRVRSSAKQMVSLGAGTYSRISGWSVTLNYMIDVYSENTTRGHFFKIKLCRKL